MGTSVANRCVTEDIEVQGAFDLAACAGFTSGSVSAAHDGSPVLRLAFPVDGSWASVGALVRQRAPDVVSVEVSAPPGPARAAVTQVRRMLSLDLDGVAFAAVAEADPVVGRLWRRHPGLRPVLFGSPYEAACWAVVCHRLRIAQAARLTGRLIERYGVPVEVGGVVLPAFPAPGALRDLDRATGLSDAKLRRLEAIGRAALDGALDAGLLRSMTREDALAHVRQLPGIGPFSAELVVARGAGHPDLFPREEVRLHTEMACRYGVSDPGELEHIAQGWQPYRSWVAFLLRASRELRTGERAGGRLRPSEGG